VTELSPGQKALVMIGLGAIVLALIVLTLNHARRADVPAAVQYTAPQPQSAPSLVAVHVVGAVRQPGVYYVPPQSRVQEAIRQAGGLTADADASSVNLAALVQDGEQVKVAFAQRPEQAAGQDMQVTAPVRPVPSAPPEVTPVAGTNAPPVEVRRPGPALDLTRVKPISLSGGTKQDLEALPGIGPHLADGIIHYRASHGPFRAVDDLVNVPGFGEGRIEALRPYVVP